jgi:hypothetical protein
MGAFNIIRAKARCPHCAAHVDVKVQFKYGDTWQYEYGLGDSLRWGGNDNGEPGKRSVVVSGVADGPCPACGFDGDWDLYVFVEADLITRVISSDGTHDFVAAQKTYLVLQE